mmetsp:Transcript_20376/g.42735  ORF Transcript_20376/g.42735 Transcript_20376/m.42735 type:complete len:93 (-) Transcript_20376:208-486(-)
MVSLIFIPSPYNSGLVELTLLLPNLICSLTIADSPSPRGDDEVKVPPTPMLLPAWNIRLSREDEDGDAGGRPGFVDIFRSDVCFGSWPSIFG